MKIQLKNTKIEHLNFTSSDVEESDELLDDSFSLQVANGYSDSVLNFFIVKFVIEVISQHGYNLQLTYVAEFETDESVTSEFKDSHFPVVNAPAIAYPYLRSFVSLLTLNSGYETLILPTINFQDMAKRNKNSGK